MQTFLIVPTGVSVGRTSACLGLIRALDLVGIRAGFMKPFAQTELNADGDRKDRSSLLISKLLKRPIPSAIEQSVVERMLGDGQLDELLEQIMSMKNESRQGCDVLIVEGMVPTSESSYAPQLNAALAQSLDANIIIVTSVDVNHLQGLAERLDLASQAFGGAGSSRVLGYILNRVKGITAAALEQPAELANLQKQIIQALKPVTNDIADHFHLIGLVPYDDADARCRPSIRCNPDQRRRCLPSTRQARRSWRTYGRSHVDRLNLWYVSGDPWGSRGYSHRCQFSHHEWCAARRRCPHRW
jgi:phosphate acetyltransferase